MSDRKPFHESVVLLINNPEINDEASLAILCCLVERTHVPVGNNSAIADAIHRKMVQVVPKENWGSCEERIAELRARDEINTDVPNEGVFPPSTGFEKKGGPHSPESRAYDAGVASVLGGVGDEGVIKNTGQGSPEDLAFVQGALDAMGAEEAGGDF